MSAPFTISNEQARALILARTFLSDARADAGAAATVQLIRRLGYVQLDPIRVVERAHHHILFARNSAYRPKQLERLQAEEPALFFENWTHDSSLIPIEFYPYWQHRFADTRKRIAKWRERFGNDRILKTVRAHVEKQGAVRARDLLHLGGRTGPWWGWGPAKAALEFLWRSGQLAVVRRSGFEKIYDLAERSIPASLREAKLSRSEVVGWACSEALQRLGAATPKMLSDFWGHASIAEAQAWIAAEKKRRRLVDVVLEGVSGQRDFAAVARPDIAAHLPLLPPPSARLRVLSPFDPLLRDRSRAERIFGFGYRIEVYVPQHKRKHGYYVFPLLEDDRLVGRIDMKAERNNDRLVVNGLWMEPGLSLGKQRGAKLQQELARQGRLAGVRDIVFPNSAIKTG
ncbi:MAG TPA: crosslink repair DNA glycosylase YcaQ family protein [Rhizomicrobium sp.]|nr:crosslink repair DNA glycosylase YcaQ family protein [Rhizomicrobium sp.]